MGLQEYNRKRDFSKTPEPKAKVEKTNQRRFVVQEHHASKLHYDFRLEIGGVLKSWAVPRGPSQDPRQKRLAVMTEDHPVAYLDFEGRIPDGEYGAGILKIWDRGSYDLVGDATANEQLKQGRLAFRLRGEKLTGEFSLLRMKARYGGEKEEGNNWLLIKSNDRYADQGWQLEPILREKRTSPSPVLTKEGRRRSAQSVKKIKVRGKAEPAGRVFKSKPLRGDAKVQVDRNIVALTSLDKVYWHDAGFTKGDLERYYYEIADYMLPYLQDRPLIMKRFPNGIDGKFFFQHDVDQVPDYVRTYTTTALGHTVDYVICDNTATVLYLANLGVIPIHPWHSRVQAIEHPDWFVFDLDPGEVEFKTICELALRVKDVLDRLELDSYAKTSGSRGMHVYVPIKAVYTYEVIEQFTARVAKLIAEENPNISTTVRSLHSRKANRIYVDYLQNARGKTVVAPYSVRERPGATVSAPLEWAEVKGKKISPKDFTIENMLARVKNKGDLFKEVLTNKQRLERGMKNLERLTRPKRRASARKK